MKNKSNQVSEKCKQMKIDEEKQPIICASTYTHTYIHMYDMSKDQQKLWYSAFSEFTFLIKIQNKRMKIKTRCILNLD